MATMVQPEPQSTPTWSDVTRDVSNTLGNPSKGYFMLLGVVLLVLGFGAFSLLWQIRFGLGVAGVILWQEYP